ncbi:hypothetical protein VOLCADRAFT_104846 [Volvox carteri f. nagariensis]|uniref:VASt domain-containing protein n=1 Tax=Volvox carteri f. nagariensis TaxID=3068 RepID=D8TWH3_VOLCA|nr:uncharacterized protein VOLCADRAFT_104846 [Volvox carteri f. nagariensis]EFJ48154.1 hypothetical protein VOLCADRAFT_104846 [Volvox carteri f. nagariensis]|eukprot:XP_002950839.1 hypothetical protein VOLCADRAFT_104846 [Volvox carteri f. nagariensis]
MTVHLDRVSRLYTQPTYNPGRQVGPIKLQPLPGRGRGLVADRDIPAAEAVLLSEAVGGVLRGPPGAELRPRQLAEHLERLQRAGSGSGSGGGGDGDGVGLGPPDRVRLRLLYDGSPPDSPRSLRNRGASLEADFLKLEDKLRRAAEAPKKAKGKGFGAPAAAGAAAAAGAVGQTDYKGSVDAASLSGAPLQPDELLRTALYNSWGHTAGELGATALRGEVSGAIIGESKRWFELLWYFALVSAVQDISRGAEVTTSYLGELALAPLERRREWLRGAYGFECECDRCTAEASIPPPVTAAVAAAYQSAQALKTKTEGEAAAAGGGGWDLEASSVRQLGPAVTAAVEQLEAAMDSAGLPARTRSWLRASAYTAYYARAALRDVPGGSEVGTGGGGGGGGDEGCGSVLFGRGGDASRSPVPYSDPAIPAELAEVISSVASGTDLHLYLTLEALSRSAESFPRDDPRVAEATRICLRAHILRYGRTSDTVLRELLQARSTYPHYLGRVDCSASAPSGPAAQHQEQQQQDGERQQPLFANNPVFYAGVMVRGHKGDLVRLFELPPTEGRMYIFDHYVCFYSAVFGFAKKRRMPTRTIKAVRKRKHLGFPNSLEIETDDYKEFFTSFLSREEAYQLINKQLQEAKRSGLESGSSRVRRSTDNGSFFNGAGNGTIHEQSSPQSASRGGTLDGGGGRRGGGGPHGGCGSGGGAARGGLNGERSLLTRHSGSLGDDDNDDEEDSGSVWVMEPRPAPAVAAGSRHVLHTTLPGSPREFFDVVLADSAPFFEDFLDSQGNRRINLTSWKRHPQLGYVRDMNFTAPIKGAFGNWGVSHTACFQSQRFCLYEDEHIVFESSQTMTDIPYGDCFTVDQRWDIRREVFVSEGGGADTGDRATISFDLHVRVPFTSRCLFKSVIESGSVKQVQDTYAQFVEQLRPFLEERLLSRNTLNMTMVHQQDNLPPPQLSQTPRLNRGGGGMGSLAARSTQMTRSVQLQRTASHLTSRTPGRHVTGSAAFESADFGEGGVGGGTAAQQLRQSFHLGGGDSRGGGNINGEHSVARLLRSLGRRLAEGARGVFESGVDVVLNLSQCRTTPQMRFLIALVLAMFLANAVCMLGYLWHGWSSSSAASVAGGGGSGGGGGAVALDGIFFGPLLPDGGAAAVMSDLSAALGAAAGTGGSGGGAGGGGGGGVSYWVQRMALLQQEIQLLQGRMEILSREVSVVMVQLTKAAGSAAAAAATGGADPAAAAAATVAGGAFSAAAGES